MIAVITGDIIGSRKGKVETWINKLKDTLIIYGEEPKKWEIYRGDSFQLSIPPEIALLAALHIKSAIKQTKLQDVRIAIGIGDEKHQASKITEANGPAYINSGECFESLKKQTLAIKSNNSNFDEEINVMLSLYLLTANNWSSTASTVIKTAIENPQKNQKSLAQILNKSQSSVSEALKRGGFDEMQRMNEYYKNNILQSCYH